jgi:hypothetical protein
MILSYFFHILYTLVLLDIVGHHVLPGGTNYLALFEVVNYHHPKIESVERYSEEN